VPARLGVTRCQKRVGPEGRTRTVGFRETAPSEKAFFR
jgi:hypothetical protein